MLSCDKIQETEVVCIRSYVVVPLSNSGYMAPEYDVFRFGKRIVDFIHPKMIEDSADRPTMSSVVIMLASGSVPLPQPTQPAVSVGRIVARPGQFSPGAEICSDNDVTLSSMSPR
ncbi:hypothetical protein WN944_012100 [Citrus x changshan-huyou]|uniref:Uncharacterized protein n=1 Tax=Citrus x changshan-huyou TaxID=2935761 RepID=A0AAP0MZB6_9ROSI